MVLKKKAEKIRVLLVEDSEDQINMCSQVLSKKAGFLLDIATNGNEAMAKISDDNYDIVLLDYLLPEISGLDILKKVKKDGFKKPIILVTAEGSEEVATEALKNGASDYIKKTGSHFIDLAHIIHKNLEKYELEQQLLYHSQELERRVEERTKELIRSEERFRDLFDNVDDIVYTHDLEGKFKSINKAAETLLGFKKYELLNMRIQDFVSARDSDHISLVLSEVLNTGAAHGFEIWLTNNVGENIPFEGNASIIYEEGEAVGIRAILRNISDRKKSEEELMKKLMKYRIEKGRVYLSLNRKMREREDILNDAINSGFRAIIISRTIPDETEKKFGNKSNIYWLSETDSDKNSISPNLSNLISKIKELLDPYTLIFLDRLDYLISLHGFSKVLNFIERLNELFYFEKGVMVISVDPNTLKPKELSLLENEIIKIELKRSYDLSDVLIEILRYVYKENTEGNYPSYKDIGIKFNVTKATVRKRITALKNDGLIVERKRGRFKMIELTDEGRSLF